MPITHGISDGKARSSWTSMAFIVESVLLLVFLVSSLAVLTNVFLSSLDRSVESRTLDAATIAATSIAEHFASDPTGVDEQTQLGDLQVVCTVTEEPRTDGIMYHADINVYDSENEDPVYSISTARYESEAS